MSTNYSQPTPLQHDDLVIPPNERKTMITLLADDCRWPFGDPLHGDFHFCGKHKMPGFSYCEFHRRLGFQTKQLRFRPYGAGER
jgi:GcrA cell cycle regulator